MKTKKMNKKFSIFEMLVVLSILSILASLILGSFGLARDEAKRTKCAHNLRQIQSIYEVYRKDHRETPSAVNRGDLRFAQEYVDASSLNIFHCPGDEIEYANNSIDDLDDWPVLNNGTSYMYIPSQADVDSDCWTDTRELYEFLLIYDKDSRFHNGRFNVLELHGSIIIDGGIASSGDGTVVIQGDEPGTTPPTPPEGEGRNNHGHGNNVDGVDMSNPGRAPKVDQSTDDDEIKPAGRMN